MEANTKLNELRLKTCRLRHGALSVALVEYVCEFLLLARVSKILVEGDRSFEPIRNERLDESEAEAEAEAQQTRQPISLNGHEERGREAERERGRERDITPTSTQIL